jgi:hypothetical protein
VFTCVCIIGSFRFSGAVILQKKNQKALESIFLISPSNKVGLPIGISKFFIIDGESELTS